MAATYLCDYCRAAINTDTDASLLVAIHRRVDNDEWGDAPSEVVSGQELTYRYCSQQHAGQHLERVPLPVITGETEISDTEVFGVLLAVLVGLGALALAIYGGVQFWQEVAQGWF